MCQRKISLSSIIKCLRVFLELIYRPTLKTDWRRRPTHVSLIYRLRFESMTSPYLYRRIRSLAEVCAELHREHGGEPCACAECEFGTICPMVSRIALATAAVGSFSGVDCMASLRVMRADEHGPRRSCDEPMSPAPHVR